MFRSPPTPQSTGTLNASTSGKYYTVSISIFIIYNIKYIIYFTNSIDYLITVLCLVDQGFDVPTDQYPTDPPGSEHPP